MILTGELVEEFKDRLIASFLIVQTEDVFKEDSKRVTVDKNAMSARVWDKPESILSGIETKDIMGFLGAFMLEKQIEECFSLQKTTSEYGIKVTEDVVKAQREALDSLGAELND